MISASRIEEDFRLRENPLFSPPHPTRFARHLPRHGKADRLASADNQGEDNKAILFFTDCSTAYLNCSAIMLLYCLTENANLLNMLSY